MMTCVDVRARLEDHLDSLLSAWEAAVVAEHLAHCAGCRAEYNHLADLGTAARALPRELTPAADLWPGISACLTSRRQRRVQWVRANRRPVVSVGLLAAAAITAAIMLPEAPTQLPAADGPLAQIQLLDDSYRDVRAGLTQALAQRCAELPEATCAEVKGSVQTLDDSAAALGKALRGGGGHPQETMLLINNYEMTIDRARGLTNRLIRI
jgi:predicted anti-sigma-YlaC factor YlaD